MIRLNKWRKQKFFSEKEIDEIIKENYPDRSESLKSIIRDKLRKEGSHFEMNFFAMSKEDFIRDYEDSRKSYKIKPNYDFSKLPNLINSKTELVTIICRDKIGGIEIGEFKINYRKFIEGRREAPVFGKVSKFQENFNAFVLNTKIKRDEKLETDLKEFIENKFGKTRFDLSKLQYFGYYIPVLIKCNTCGEWIWLTPRRLREENEPCKNCSIINYGINYSIGIEEYQRRSDEIHGDKKFTVLNTRRDKNNEKTFIKVRCEACQTEYEVSPKGFLKSEHGCCPNCWTKAMAEIKTNDQEDIIKRIEKVHGKGVLDFSLMEYKGLDKKVKIIDITTGDIFEMTPGNLLLGYGNPLKHMSSGERKVKAYLDSKNIEFLYDYRVYGIEGRNENYVEIDFVFDINNQKYWIEYNGAQHYGYYPFYHKGEPYSEFSINEWHKQLKRDENVRNYCKENNITLIEIPYTYVSPNTIADIIDKVIYEGVKLEDIVQIPSITYVEPNNKPENYDNV